MIAFLFTSTCLELWCLSLPIDLLSSTSPSEMFLEKNVKEMGLTYLDDYLDINISDNFVNEHSQWEKAL